tara:strand:+ start:305 stop:463 length:159 start_codon:yes stop_codon:yes gene_type:complete
MLCRNVGVIINVGVVIMIGFAAIRTWVGPHTSLLVELNLLSNPTYVTLTIGP